jgi:hypothetical protein
MKPSLLGQLQTYESNTQAYHLTTSLTDTQNTCTSVVYSCRESYNHNGRLQNAAVAAATHLVTAVNYMRKMFVTLAHD